MFAWLKNLFSKKQKPQQTPVAAPVAEPLTAPVAEPVKEKMEPRPEEIHREKNCPHCSAPNDAFVSKCWLCKKDI
jgi:hypothetical protein